MAHLDPTRLPAIDPRPLAPLGFDDLIASHRACEWLRGKSFREIRFADGRGWAHYALLAQRQGLAFAETRIAVDDDGPDEPPLRGLVDLVRSFLRRSCREPAPAPRPDATPLVSVCMAHKDRPGLLSQALDSLRAQDYPRFEVVVVDDGSTRPESLAALDELEADFATRGWRIVRQENRYLGAARNAAASAAKGEYLLFMDDDNVAKPGEISTLVRAALQSDLEIAAPLLDEFAGMDAPGAATRPLGRRLFLGPAAAVGLFRNAFGDANALVRRSTFERLGGFTEDAGVTHEDWEFFARAALEGARMEVVPEALFWYRVQPGSMISATRKSENARRGLRPYLAATPGPLRDLVGFLHGSDTHRPLAHKLVDAALARLSPR